MWCFFRGRPKKSNEPIDVDVLIDTAIRLSDKADVWNEEKDLTDTLEGIVFAFKAEWAIDEDTANLKKWLNRAEKVDKIFEKLNKDIDVFLDKSRRCSDIEGELFLKKLGFEIRKKFDRFISQHEELRNVSDPCNNLERFLSSASESEEVTGLVHACLY